ncbi:hypothetical protein V8F20_006099 [Naviculisporaceae sp. PSN 640]
MEPESTETQGASAFHLFPYLPAELRLEIWRQSCRSRVVEVHYSSTLDRCLTNTPPPVILQVCHESRHEGQRLYIQAFGTHTHPEGTIHFSPEMDILYIPRCEKNMGYGDTARDFGQYVLNTVDHVRALAIDHVNPVVRRPWETYNKFCLMRTFPNLREAFLILDFPSPSSSPRHSGEYDYDAASATASENGQIEFVDPRGDPREIMGIMERVRESFDHEVGQSQFDAGPSPLEKVDNEWEQEEHSVWEQPYMALVPKTKVRTRTPDPPTQARSWSMQPTFVACV